MLIYIDYNKSMISVDQIERYARGIEKVVSETTKIEDHTPTYVRATDFTLNAAPIEIFLQVSPKFLTDEEELMLNLRYALGVWKEQANIHHPINITLMPMTWRFELNI